MSSDLIPLRPPVVADGAELAGLFDSRLTTDFNQEERSLLGVLMSQEDRIDVAIPDDTTTDRLWGTLSVCSKVFTRVSKAKDILKLLVGRVLNIMQSRPDMWRERGFVSFDAFLSDKLRGLPYLLGISRAELYAAKTIAEKHPTISVTQFRAIGFNKLSKVSIVTREGNNNYREWMQAAEECTLRELRQKIYLSDSQIPKGALEYDVLVIECTKDIKDELKEFLEDARWASKCGSKDWAQILVWAVREAGAEWEAQANGSS